MAATNRKRRGESVDAVCLDSYTISEGDPGSWRHGAPLVGGAGTPGTCGGTLTFTLDPFHPCAVSVVWWDVFPLCTCMSVQNQTCQKATRQEVSFGKAPDLRLRHPLHPRILACVWPSLATAAGFWSFRPWSRSELECPARKGAPWRPPERPRLRVARGVGAGGSQPTDENSKCSPAWAANRFQIGRVRARAAAAWLHKQPVAPDGGWLQPGEQVHGGLGGMAAGGGPPPRLIRAGRPLLPLIHASLSGIRGLKGL